MSAVSYNLENVCGLHVLAQPGWGHQGWACGEREQVREREMEVEETSMEGDSKRQPAFLMCRVQRACLS